MATARLMIVVQAVLAALALARPSLAAPPTVEEIDLGNPYREPVERARLKVEEDRARLDHDLNAGNEDSVIHSDKSQLATDVHVLSAFTREYNREAIRKIKKRVPSSEASDGAKLKVDTD